MPPLGLLIDLCALFGLAVGSFLNVVIYRVPRHESIVSPPSARPSCAAPIAPRDNVPVLSWIVLRGRCRHCRSPISWQYPFVELATADGLLAHEHPLGNRVTYGYSRRRGPKAPSHDCPSLTAFKDTSVDGECSTTVLR